MFISHPKPVPVTLVKGKGTVLLQPARPHTQLLMIQSVSVRSIKDNEVIAPPSLSFPLLVKTKIFFFMCYLRRMESFRPERSSGHLQSNLLL